MPGKYSIAPKPKTLPPSEQKRRSLVGKNKAQVAMRKAVACPVCKAAKGRRCVWEKAGRSTECHPERVKAYKALTAKPERPELDPWSEFERSVQTNFHRPTVISVRRPDPRLDEDGW